MFRDKPLAFYIFSDNSKLVEKMITRISSGGVCINDTLMHHNRKSFLAAL